MLLQAAPIVVRIVEEPVHELTVADVLIGALGLTGALVLAALVLGALLGGILIGRRILRSRDTYNDGTIQPLGLT
ncbi:MAG: hypothetical protein LC804_11570 [Acidobacteria bacterium]|nr:hypothetical protein [Acidobacteriota bacterium]